MGIFFHFERFARPVVGRTEPPTYGPTRRGIGSREIARRPASRRSDGDGGERKDGRPHLQTSGWSLPCARPKHPKGTATQSNELNQVLVSPRSFLVVVGGLQRHMWTAGRLSFAPAAAWSPLTSLPRVRARRRTQLPARLCDAHRRKPPSFTGT